jgi:hypothetical protein
MPTLLPQEGLHAKRMASCFSLSNPPSLVLPQLSRRACNQTKDLWAIFLHNAQSDARQCQ